ncbi:hypothetical protein F9L33_05275 [Amylibacter sp. SFDW26]|uniref:hypothetical protein n=1 Tax=Amylibacter sp. SFDW26 TaxID=2652722 RepID=UPI0012625ABA|nr:hypothetical protein [Amylibacter sp. SFDW26]KAB7616164.1 hypothetical protein F9L33_05275 [Amylibacter sp. SFDW26]
MTKKDFQDRLQRINKHSQQPEPINECIDYKPRSRGSKVRAFKVNYKLAALGGGSIGLGNYFIKNANENYQVIKSSGGIGAAAGLGLVGAIAVLFGIITIVRATAKANNVTAYETPNNMVQPVRQASNKTRVITSLIGFVLGMIACLYMFLSSAARLIETETANTFANGGLLIAVILAFLSLLVGFMGLFLRGYALGRVPLYFLFGCMLTFGFVRVLGVNMLEWAQFTNTLQ